MGNEGQVAVYFLKPFCHFPRADCFIEESFFFIHQHLVDPAAIFKNRGHFFKSRDIEAAIRPARFDFSRQRNRENRISKKRALNDDDSVWRRFSSPRVEGFEIALGRVFLKSWGILFKKDKESSRPSVFFINRDIRDVA